MPRPTDEELATKRRECVRSLPTRRWRHKKSGKSYFVVDVAILTEPEAHLAFVYYPADPSGPETPFVRGRDHFLSSFEPLEPEKAGRTKPKENACPKASTKFSS